MDRSLISAILDAQHERMKLIDMLIRGKGPSEWDDTIDRILALQEESLDALEREVRG